MSILTLPRELQLHILGLLSVSELMQLSQTCRRLKDLARDPSLWRKLTLTYNMIKNNTVACRDHVSRCSNLQELFITVKERSIRSDKIMSVVMRAKDSLRSFDISHNYPGLARDPGLSNSSVKKFAKITQLRKLSLSGVNIRPDGMTELGKLTELTTLKVMGLGIYDFEEWYPDIVNLFGDLKKLEQVKISIGPGPFSDKIVESLVTNNPSLSHLDINSRFCRLFFNDKNVGTTLGKNIINIITEKCPKLTHIDLGCLDIIENDDLLKLATNCVNLKFANFEETRIEDSTLAMLARNCKNLESLNVSWCENITEKGIEAFLNLSSKESLKQLDITECEFLYIDDYENDHHVEKRLVQEYPLIKIVYDMENDESDQDESSNSDYDLDY